VAVLGCDQQREKAIVLRLGRPQRAKADRLGGPHDSRNIAQLASTVEGPLQEMVCADNPNAFFPSANARPLPQTAVPDF